MDVRLQLPVPPVRFPWHDAVPSLTVTVPVGFGLCEAVTEKLTVYACPTTLGSGVSPVIVVVVTAAVTGCDTGVEVLVAKFVVATYVPVTDFVPAVTDVRSHEPTPPLSGALHVAPVPSLTVTLPVGVPAPGATATTLTATAYASPTWVAALKSLVIVVAVAAAFTWCATPPDVLAA